MTKSEGRHPYLLGRGDGKYQLTRSLNGPVSTEGCLFQILPGDDHGGNTLFRSCSLLWVDRVPNRLSVTVVGVHDTIVSGRFLL